MIDLKPIVQAILSEYGLPWDGTHGVSHWARVLENGLRLAEETGADTEVVRLFAVFHDSQRVNEGTDGFGGDESAKTVPIVQGEVHRLVGRRVLNDLGIGVIQTHEVVENELPLGGGQL